MLTRADVAELLKVSVRTVDRLRRRRQLPATKLGAAVRFAAHDVQSFLTNRRESVR
jgi:excisionase family DNA binding protein